MNYRFSGGARSEKFWIFGCQKWPILAKIFEITVYGGADHVQFLPLGRNTVNKMNAQKVA